MHKDKILQVMVADRISHQVWYLTSSACENEHIATGASSNVDETRTTSPSKPEGSGEKAPAMRPSVKFAEGGRVCTNCAHFAPICDVSNGGVSLSSSEIMNHKFTKI
mmetsp:Transcript_2247/g.7161  ORF Transcript_2247/g.7161 Transcript_2247/m.7161 type:complete len:107 (-) Transcript_2247:838-1158(-)